MSANPPISRLIIRAAFVFLLTAGACLILRFGHNAAPVSSIPASAADHPGIICHSAHYVLTADIHAGS